MTANPIANVGSPGRVQQAIANAANRTGIDFDYLLGQAKVESGLNARARAGTSSATGLYQFIESSWLNVVKKHGAEHGLGWAADAIGPGGRVANAATRQAILGLRNDPVAASLMAAEHASDNKGAIESALGRKATGTDLYMAHFLGLGGATKFLSRMDANPDASAAALFPSAARANRGVFFDRTGNPRSLAQVYDRFAGKLGAGADSVTETRAANLSFAAQVIESGALDMGGDATVVTGSNESATDALAWGRQQLGRVNPYRPTPDTARLAYLMLARMGG